MATNRAIKSQITMEEQGDTSKLFVKILSPMWVTGFTFQSPRWLLKIRNLIFEITINDQDSVLTINTVNISDGVVSWDNGAASL